MQKARKKGLVARVRDRISSSVENIKATDPAKLPVTRTTVFGPGPGGSLSIAGKAARMAGMAGKAKPFWSSTAGIAKKHLRHEGLRHARNVAAEQAGYTRRIAGMVSDEAKELTASGKTGLADWYGHAARSGRARAKKLVQAVRGAKDEGTARKVARQSDYGYRSMEQWGDKKLFENRHAVQRALARARGQTKAELWSNPEGWLKKPR